MAGIGRPIDLDWLRVVEGELSRALTPPARVSMRFAPGITYASGSELIYRELIQPGESYETTSRGVQELAKGVLGELIEIGEVDPTTASQTALTYLMHPLNTKRYSNKPSALVVDLHDPPAQSYEFGRQFSGERIAVRKLLGLSLEDDFRPASRKRRVLVGSFFDISDASIASVLYRIADKIPRPVEVDNFGVIRTDTKED